jgi:hypothetical protein
MDLFKRPRDRYRPCGRCCGAALREAANIRVVSSVDSILLISPAAGKEARQGKRVYNVEPFISKRLYEGD